MAWFTKSFLKCDRCGKVVEVPASARDLGLGTMAARDAGLNGWIEAVGGHQLCPDCAKPYTAKQAEMERELKRLAGIETVEVDL